MSAVFDFDPDDTGTLIDGSEPKKPGEVWVELVRWEVRWKLYGRGSGKVSVLAPQHIGKAVVERVAIRSLRRSMPYELPWERATFEYHCLADSECEVW